MVRNLLLLQCISTPIGISPTPFWTNLYLYDYETDFIPSQIKTDRTKMIKFNY